MVRHPLSTAGHSRLPPWHGRPARNGLRPSSASLRPFGCAIAFSRASIDKGFSGEIRTLSIRASVEIRPNRGKGRDVQPDYRVWSDDVEIGAGWLRVGRNSGEPYVSLALEAPEFGQRRLYANLGRAAGQDSDDIYAIIWNPMD